MLNAGRAPRPSFIGTNLPTEDYVTHSDQYRAAAGRAEKAIEPRAPTKLDRSGDIALAPSTASSMSHSAFQQRLRVGTSLSSLRCIGNYVHDSHYGCFFVYV